jgi:hypothetical protein
MFVLCCLLPNVVYSAYNVAPVSMRNNNTLRFSSTISQEHNIVFLVPSAKCISIASCELLDNGKEVKMARGLRSSPRPEL